MIKTFRIILLGLAWCFLSTCRNEEIPEPSSCGDAQTVEQMKEWVYFKTGTWWIYEEETTGIRDTVTVTSDGEGLSQGGYETFGSVWHSSLDGYNYDYWFNDSYSGVSTQDNCFSRRISCSKYMPGEFFGAGYVYIFPLIKGRTAGIQSTTSLDGQFSIQLYPFTYISLQDTFINCVKFHTPYAVQHNWAEANYTVAKNYGVVRKEVVGLGQNWNLIEYEIVP